MEENRFGREPHYINSMFSFDSGQQRSKDGGNEKGCNSRRREVVDPAIGIEMLQIAVSTSL
jgi:hypothetical protein